MNDTKIIAAVNGEGGTYALKSLQKSFSTIAVLTEDDDIKEMLRESDFLINSLQDSPIDVVVCAAYMDFIPKDVLNSKKYIINTHPSLLPKYRGIHALAWAMLNLENELGFTVHLMNEHMDDGPILEQYKIEYNNQTSRDIMLMFHDYVLDHLGRITEELLNGKIEPREQDINEATWVSKRNLDDCLIDFNASNKYIRAMFKALVKPYPLPMIKVKDKNYEISEFELLDKDYHMHIGRVVNVQEGNVYIKTKEGVLIIKQLHPMGKSDIIKPSNILKLGQRL